MSTTGAPAMVSLRGLVGRRGSVVPTVLNVGQNLGWAIGYNAVALPIAAGVFEPTFGLVLRPEIAALTMSGSSLLVAVNALLLKRLPLPARSASGGDARAADNHDEKSPAEMPPIS